MITNPNTDSRLLEEIAKSLDISPSDYERAKKAVSGVSACLENGHPDYYPGSPSKPMISLQGSMRLGTAIRPLRDGAEGDFDVDLVVELSAAKGATDPKSIKHQIGKRLKDDGTYGPMMDEEGGRCWTLNYAEQNKIGFHMDVLPCVHEQDQLIADMAHDLHAQGKQPGWALTAISITDHDKATATYRWKASNPSGYAEWFASRNQTAFIQFRSSEKHRILLESSASGIYSTEDQVPDELVRTPLQRTVQILKRHRDIRFSTKAERNIKPISVIITTLAAQIYAGEQTVEQVLRKIVDRLSAYGVLQENRAAMLSGIREEEMVIRRLSDGTWQIPNPVNAHENIADKWHLDDQARAKAFFRWVTWLKQDILQLIDGVSRPDQTKKLLVERLIERKQFPLDIGQQERRTPVVPAVVSSVGAARPWGQ